MNNENINKDKNYRNRRTLGIVLMLIIIGFSSILMITTFTEELFFGTGGNYGVGNIVDDTDDSALLTLQYGSDIDFKVPMVLMQREAFNYTSFDDFNGVTAEIRDNDKLIISDATNSQTTINLSTQKKNGIECYYDLVFMVEKNNFEPVYDNNKNKMNELSISLVGKDINDNTFESNEILLLDEAKGEMPVKSNIKVEAYKDKPVFQTWDIKFHFINYRYIDQNINLAKELKGKFKVENFQCLTKK